MSAHEAKWALGKTHTILRILCSKEIITTICAAFAAIVMVIFLTITINHAREQKIIQIFSEQQNKFCRSLALNTASFLEKSKESFEVLAANLPANRQAREKAIGAFYKKNARFVTSIALINNHTVSYTSGMLPLTSDELPYQKDKKFVGTPEDAFLVLNKFLKDGSRLEALISIKKAISHLNPEKENAISSHILIADIKGNILAQVPENQRLNFTKESLVALIQSPTKHPPFAAYPQLHYWEAGKNKIATAAAYRLTEESEAPFLITLTDSKVIIAAARTAFLNNMAGVAFLVIVVILSAVVVLYNLYHRLSLQQELENIRLTKEWEKQLEAEKRTAEGIVEGTPIPAFVIDREHKIIFWNKACEDLTGYKRTEMIGTRRQYEPFYGKEQQRPIIADLIVDKKLEIIDKLYSKKKVRSSQTIADAYEANDFFQDLNGKARHLFFIAAPIYDEEGNIIAAVETLQDVTAAVEMNKQLSEYAETLENEVATNVSIRKEMETLYNYLNSIVKSLPDALFDVNENGTINNIIRNDRDEAWSESHRGKHIRELVPVYQQEELLSKWENVKQGKIISFELEVANQKFPTKNFFITCNPVSGTKRYVVIRRDITELKSLERKFYESQRLAAMGHLAAGIAHEIRNPLSSIKMSLQILKKRLSPTENDLRRMDIALTEVAHLESLVSDVLIYAKPANPNKKPHNINKITEDALVLQESALSAKKISVEKVFTEPPPISDVDEGMMLQVFINIYRNAIEAMEEGGKLRIETGLTPNCDVFVEVVDNGKGIDSINMDHIFDPFFTADKPYGTGLGLTQVRRLIELHNGDIGIISTPGVGTKVTITLPIEQAAGKEI